MNSFQKYGRLPKTAETPVPTGGNNNSNNNTNMVPQTSAASSSSQLTNSSQYLFKPVKSTAATVTPATASTAAESAAGGKGGGGDVSLSSGSRASSACSLPADVGMGGSFERTNGVREKKIVTHCFLSSLYQ